MGRVKYKFAKHSFAAALDSIGSHPTSHEGLYRAHIESLSCIDAFADLPPRLQGRYLKLLKEVVPQARHQDSSVSSLLGGIRQLTERQVDEQIRMLAVMSEELNRC